MAISYVLRNQPNTHYDTIFEKQFFDLNQHRLSTNPMGLFLLQPLALNVTLSSAPIKHALGPPSRPCSLCMPCMP